MMPPKHRGCQALRAIKPPKGRYVRGKIAKMTRCPFLGRLRRLFPPMRTQFITSAAGPAGFPDIVRPECAVAGRSNVGKSTLLNRLVNAKVARTSKTPGRTQTINFFDVLTGSGHFTLADLPGYGYAKVPQSTTRLWGPLIETYLETRDPLRLILLLVDIRRGAGEDEAGLDAWLRERVSPRGVEVLVVATKADKLPKARRKPAAWSIADALERPRDQILITSAQNVLGMDTLRTRLEALAPRV